MTLEKKLARIARYRTAYELAMVHPDGRRVLVCYSNGRSRNDVFTIVQKRAQHVARLLGVAAESLQITFAKRSGEGATIGEWSVVWTGRTQREAYIAGELEYVGRIGLEPATPVLVGHDGGDGIG